MVFLIRLLWICGYINIFLNKFIVFDRNFFICKLFSNFLSKWIVLEYRDVDRILKFWDVLKKNKGIFIKYLYVNYII